MMNPASQYHEKRFTMHFSICRFKFACLFTALLSAAVLVERPVCGQDPAKQDSEQCFLWKVSSKTTTVYLLGSMHVAKADFFPLPKEVEDAFAKSKILVVELNTEELDQAKLQGLLLQKGIYPPGEALSKKIVAGRPFANKAQLVSKKIIPKATYDKISDKIIAKQAK